ncbi:MAG: hypothetical protein COV91_02815, partial [Candidatus Taylorbacteria bacterium CG11_big_fil_rev_8_21_14_0_20_46_11]
ILRAISRLKYAVPLNDFTKETSTKYFSGTAVTYAFPHPQGGMKWRTKRKKQEETSAEISAVSSIDFLIFPP